MDWALRLAKEDDILKLEALIESSVYELQAASYSTAQMDGALGPVFGVDRQLIRDCTYFVIEQQNQRPIKTGVLVVPAVTLRSIFFFDQPVASFLQSTVAHSAASGVIDESARDQV
jgi:hypothetical protein